MIAQTQAQEVLSLPCPVCGEPEKPGERRAIEILPDNAKLWVVEHSTGKVCRWADQDEPVLKKKKKEAAVEVKCPRCGKTGKVSTFYSNYNLPEPDRRLRVRYRILHGSDPVCHIIDGEQRATLLKDLGRYISNPPDNGIKHKQKKIKRKYRGRDKHQRVRRTLEQITGSANHQIATRLRNLSIQILTIAEELEK